MILSASVESSGVLDRSSGARKTENLWGETCRPGFQKFIVRLPQCWIEAVTRWAPEPA